MSKSARPQPEPIVPGVYWVYGQTGDRSLPTWLHSGWHRIAVKPGPSRSKVAVARPGFGKSRIVPRLAFDGWRPVRDEGQTFGQLNSYLKGNSDVSKSQNPPETCPLRRA
jgi:hypothetical protein